MGIEEEEKKVGTSFLILSDDVCGHVSLFKE